jgi:hypothetical protein
MHWQKMAANPHNPGRAALAGPLDLNAGPSEWASWGLGFLLIYGYELFNFSLSIDEELHTFGSDAPLLWLQQGRWGMALLSRSLPPISALPVVSTALFGAGLLFAVAHLAAHYRLQGLSAQLFGVVLIASPIWPHIVEFNSLSYGIGIGLVLCAIGVRLLGNPRRLIAAFGLAALVFAAGIYQTLLLAAIVMALGRGFLADTVKTGNLFVRTVRDLALIVGAGILAFCLQYIARRFANATVTYIDIYWRVSDYLANPLVAGKASWKVASRLLFGKSRIYLGYGFVLAALPLAAFGYSLFRAQAAQSTPPLTRVFLLVLALPAALLPVFVSVGTVPARGIVAFPFVVALLVACFPVETVIERWAARTYLVVVTVLAATISSQLFYSDHLARERDRLLAASLLERLQQLRPADKPLRVTLFGEFQAAPREPLKRLEVFGTSFFEHDGGNIYRVTSYLKILGAHHLEPVDLSQVPDIAAKASALPPWPSPGSIALVDGTAVIKLGPISYAQRTRLCSISPDHLLCR